METDFKTSHVIVYRRSFGKGRSCNYISKHLMLLFITFGLPVLTFLASFQNISCYCLSPVELCPEIVAQISKHLMLLFILIIRFLCRIDSNFKTSHVIVYLTATTKELVAERFQNISCYCLSLSFPRFLVSPLPFFPLYFLYFSIFYQPTSLSWTALLIIP